MKKFLVVSVSLIFALILILALTTYFFLKNIDKGFLVNQLESNLNLRAEIGEFRLKLFSFPSEIELLNLSLTKRDSVADSGIELSKRDKIQSPLIYAEKVYFNFSFKSILQRKFSISEISFINPSIQLVLFENGGNNLVSLFQKPSVVKSAPNPALTETEKQEIKKENSPFKADKLPIALYLNLAKIENAKIKIFLQKQNETLLVENGNFSINDLKINPSELDKENNLNLIFNVNLKILNSANIEQGILKCKSDGDLKLFDSKSKLLNPAFMYNLTFISGSYLTGLPFLDALSGKIPALQKVGIELPFLSEKIQLKEDINAKISYSSGTVKFLNKFTLPTAKFDLLLNEGSVYRLLNQSHEFSGIVKASKEDSDKAMNKVDAFLSKNNKLSDFANMRNKILSPIMEGDRIALKFSSKGNIKNPEVQLLAEIPSLTDFLKDTILEKGKDKVLEEIKKKLPIKLPF